VIAKLKAMLTESGRAGRGQSTEHGGVGERRWNQQTTANANTRAGSTAASALLDNVPKIDDIVVLMMENRSFDHMLGYLSLIGERDEVVGLKTRMTNTLQPASRDPAADELA
jgi:phospholipase C